MNIFTTIWEKIKTFGRWCKKKVKQIAFTLGLIGIATAATITPITPNEIAWRGFTDNLMAIEYKHQGQKVDDLKNLKGIWEPNEQDFEKVYQYVYGYDLVVWQKLDGTEMCPLYKTPEGTWERTDLIPIWQASFNRAKEQGEMDQEMSKALRGGILNNIVNNNRYGSYSPISFNKSINLRELLIGLISEVFAAGVEVEDHFAITGGNIDLKDHTPDTTGTGWTSIYFDTDYLYIADTPNRLYISAVSGGYSAGNVCEADDVMSEADVEVKITTVNAESGDDYSQILCRIQDADNFYALQWSGSASEIVEWTGGSEVERIDGPGIANGSIVELHCEGDSIKAYDDTVEIIDYTDSTHSAAGKVGIGAGNIFDLGADCDGQAMDDFYATTLEGAAEGTNMQINIGDTWKDIDSMKINIGDVWKDIANMWINIGDSWKVIY